MTNHIEELYEIWVGGEPVWREQTTYDAALRKYGEIAERTGWSAGKRTVALWEESERRWPVKEEECGF